MHRFIGYGLPYALAVALVVLTVNSPVAEARRHKPPKDVPGLELPILAGLSTVGYVGYHLLKSRRR